jgi:hypothetical protein
MTPKEKAKNLYDEFHSVLPSYNDEGQLEHELAKRCALIAVDEIIEQCEFDVIHDIGNERYIDKLNYWDEVKQEIEKL